MTPHGCWTMPHLVLVARVLLMLVFIGVPRYLKREGANPRQGWGFMFYGEGGENAPCLSL